MSPPEETSAPVLDPQVTRRYDVKEKLGRGCFANVYRVVRRHDSRELAMKVVRRHRLDGETRLLLRNEQQALRLVSQFPGVVTLHDTLETATEVCFTLQYVRGGPLLDEIVKRGNFSENDARLTLRPVLRTLAFMAKVGVVHRDIKPENLLCDADDPVWPLKLTDFGLSAKLQKDTLLHSSCGTPVFAAPEVLACDNAGYGCAADAWSFGVVLYVVLCGYAPFTQRDPYALIAAIRKGRFDFPDPEWRLISDEAKDVVRRLLTVDPQKRLTPAQALQHPWFAAQQSTSALPNHGLETFNAARKMRALLITIRTACGWRRLLASRTPASDRCEKASALFAEVEHARSRIAEIECRASAVTDPGESSRAASGDVEAEPAALDALEPSVARSRLPLLPLQSLSKIEGATRSHPTPRRRQSVRSLVLPTFDDTKSTFCASEDTDRSPRSTLVQAVGPDSEDDTEEPNVQRARAAVHELRKSQRSLIVALKGDISAKRKKGLTKPNLVPLNFSAFNLS